MRRLIVRGPGLRGPKGRDGLNVVPTDDAIAGLFADPDSESRAAMLTAVSPTLAPTIDERIAVAVLTDIPGGTGFILTTSEDGYPTIVATLEDPPDVPTVPLTLNAAPSFAQVALTWATPTSDGGAAITDYRIQYKLSAASSWTTWAHTASVVTAATITGLANGSSYDFRVAALNFSGSSPYATVTNIAPGAVNGVVASDTFTRTAAELVGTNPTIGLHAWSGATGALAANGSRAVAFSATPATGIVILDTGAKGDVVLTAVRGVSSIGEAATRNTRHYVKYVDSTNYIYLQIGLATSGTVTLTVVAKIANVDTTILTTGAWPANVIPSSTALADYAISFSVIGTAVSATVNGTTRAGTLTSPQAAALADATRVAFTVASSTYQLDDLSVSVNGTYVA